MAKSVKTVTSKISDIQSKAQETIQSNQKKVVSSTKATQEGSTTTPTVTDTPKVASTAKAMPSITRPDISSIVPAQTTVQPKTTVNAKDLLGSKTQVTPLKKAATPDLLSTKTEDKEIRKSALPLNLVRAASEQGGTAKEAVDKTLLEQFTDWFNETPEKVTQKVGDFFKGPVMSYGTAFERMINDTEYWVAGLADVIETSLGGEGGFKQAFQEQQGWYWDAYGEENDIKASKLYEQDTQAQNVSRDVSDYIWNVTGNKEMSDMIGNVVGKVTASLKDPEQIASVAGYMTPALIMQWATGGGFLTNTAIWLPSQSTQVYKDFAEDQELSSQFTDNQLFGISTGLGTVLSMVETFGDALGDMPWAKAMSRNIRNAFTKSLKKPIAEGLTKEITDVVDRNLIKDIKQPVLNALKKWYLGSIGEGLEEVTQDTLQTEGARMLGSKREGMSLEQILTTYFTAKGMGLFISGPGAALNIKNNSDLKNQYDEFSKTVDKVSPGINEDTKMAFFSAMITSQQNDANLSEKKVKEYEEQTTKLYEERSMLEQRLNQADNDEVRAKINGMIEQTDNKIKEIDKKINQWNSTKEEINKYIEERNAKAEEEETQKELEELHAEANQSIEGENLSEQTTKVPEQQGSIKVRQVALGRSWDKKDMRKIFEKSVNDIKSGTYYGDTEFAGYAYYNTSTMTKDTKDVMKMRAKVEDLLRKIGVTIRYTSNPDRDMGPGLAGLYEPSRKRVTYASGENGVQIYGHEVFHAIMDIIHNGKITDKELQTKLREILDKAINDVKKQFGIDIYKEGTEEFDIANTFAEEWLSNSFGEYLAKRELEGPKTFVQKIKEFFKQIISLFSKEGMTEMSLSKELRDAFESIANGEVMKDKPASFNRRGLTGERLGGRTGFKIPTTTEGFLSLAEALKQPQNTILSTLTELKLKELKTKTQEMWRNEGFFGKNNEAYRLIIKKINDELSVRQEQEKESRAKKLTFKNANDYIKKMIAIDKANGDWTKREDKALREKYMSNFLRTNLEGDFSAHLPGLKGVNIKQIEGKLSTKNLKDITEMLSLVSTTLGIDFNKVIMDKYMSMNIADDIKDFKYHTNSLGLMSRKATKDMIKKLSDREGGYLPATLGADIATMGVAITLQDGPMKSAATMAHELMHLIDFALSVEEGLPLYFEGNRFTYTSIIKDDNSWKTYTKGNYDKNYYNRRQEILARYAEQYFAYKNDKELFDKFAKRSWYWTEEEFVKLLPKFESFIKDRLGAKLLDEQNKFYNEVVRKINENIFKTTQIEFADRDDMTESEVKYKLAQLEAEYAWILQTVEGMKGDLKEEMEAYVQLSNLQTNYEMAKAKGEEYLEKLKTTPEQQGTIDGVTTTVLPPEPEPGNPNPMPPQKPEIIRLGLPYYGGSNIEEGVGDIAEGGDGPQLGNSYTKEEDIIKIRKKKNKIKNFFKELGQAWKDVFTPAISRIYNISPRVAGRLVTMETQTDINIYRYRQKAKGFVASLGKLKGKQALEVKAALLNYGALASEQGDNIQQYKKEQVAKLKEVLLRNGFKEQDINDMFEVLNDIGRQYEDAGLKITLSDMYFPRVVKDYEGLIDYMNRVSGKDIKVNKVSLMIKIRNIQADPDITEEEKEKKIRNAISIEFKRPGTTSEHGKERTMGDLSSWGEGIYAYYENPIEALDHYITTMTKAIQRQLFLGGMKEDADITESDILNQNTAESVSTIIGKLVEQGKVSEDDVEELQKSILAVLNKKRSPKSVTAIKDITYISTITNFLSAINQLDDLGMVILKDRSGLKHIVKTIFGKAGIKYDELGLEDAYEMFREEGGITNWLFKKSFFNMFDRLGKTSFINTAWESMIRQSKNEKTRGYLYTRLQAMYGTESADRMMEKIDSGNYMTDGQIDIEILRDLLYQLGSTQPIYTSAMPTTYLNHPRARLCYALSSFTLKRIDWLVQGTKEVNAQHGKVAAAAWLMGVSSFLAMFGAAIGDVGDLLKGKKEETFLWNLINKGIDDALAAGGSNALDSRLKIWDLSEYDIKTYKSQGLWGVISSKLKPFIFDLGKDVVEAVWEHDLDEITDLAKYVPIFGKLTYYWFWDELGKSTKSSKSSKSEWDFGEEEERAWDTEDEWGWENDEEWDWGE